MSASNSSANTFKLSVMMFLQFFTWGAWFATLGQCLGAHELAGFGGGAYGSAPLGAIFAPLFLGLIADRFFPSQVVMGILFLLGGVLLLLIPGVAAVASEHTLAAADASAAGDTAAAAAAEAAASSKGQLMVWLMVGNMLCYMPTLGLGNSISFANLDRLAFPKVRVWGTIGWIVAGLAVGFMGWTSSFNIFYLAAGSSLALGLYSFVLPHTPAPAKGEPINARALLMVDAFSLFKRPAFAVFMLCSALICIPLAYYYGLTGNYLTNAGFEQAASTMTIGQMSEIFFMLLIPFFFRKLGVKWMILVGMLAWVTRYLLFAFGAPDQVVWMLFFAVALHGICYDFFFVTGFMYTDKVAPKSIRSQAQSMLVFFTQGIGMYFGYKVAFGKFGAVVEDYTALDNAIAEATNRGEETMGFGAQLARMFSVKMPESIDPALITAAMDKWKTFWMFPAMMAGAITILFFVAFWDKIRVGDGDDEVGAEAAESPEEMP